MNEKLMQEIIIKCPSETLDEDGLCYVDREVTTGERRLDIVLKDRRDRYLLVEAQVGHLDTKHIDRHIDYCEGFITKNPNAAIRILYIANMISPYQKEFLQRRGYEFKEISQHQLSEIAEKNGIIESSSTRTPSDASVVNGISVERVKIEGDVRRDHNKGHNWDHNQPDNQDGFINSLIKEDVSIDEIVNEFKQKYPDYKRNHRSRVLRHANHLLREHHDFSYLIVSGCFKKKS
jgi:hypothetical protein